MFSFFFSDIIFTFDVFFSSQYIFLSFSVISSFLSLFFSLSLGLFYLFSLSHCLRENNTPEAIYLLYNWQIDSELQYVDKECSRNMGKYRIDFTFLYLVHNALHQLIQYIYFKELQGIRLNRHVKSHTITTPGSLEWTFDPGFGNGLHIWRD